MASESDKVRLGAWASIHGPDADIDRHKCSRVVPMEVLSLGISRTGILSMCEAYDILGYPNPYHYAKIFANVQDTDIWIDLLKAKYEGKGSVTKNDFDQVLGHCGAVTDVPCAVFWRELIETYPDAKVVLVERDEDKWVKSCEALLEGTLDPFLMYVLRFTDPFWLGRIIKTGYLWTEGFFGTLDLARAKKNSRAAYRAHNAGIKESVPKERLLQYRLGRGWEPLCEFLGKEVPDVPFPHRNEAETLKLAFGALASRALKNSLFNFAVVVAVAATLGAVLWRLAHRGV